MTDRDPRLADPRVADPRLADPRVVPDHTGFARALIYAGVPVGLLSVAIVVTVALSWGRPEGLCPTWMAFMLPYCAG